MANHGLFGAWPVGVALERAQNRFDILLLDTQPLQMSAGRVTRHKNNHRVGVHLRKWRGGFIKSQDGFQSVSFTQAIPKSVGGNAFANIRGEQEGEAA